jgi:predicted dehydrogenase
MAIAAMQARKHVVLEKPMCLSLEEARELIEVRDKTKMVLTVFHNRRWDADFLTLRRAIERGLIGKILHLETNITWHGAPGGWRVKRKQMGGWMFNWGAHLLDQACLLISSKPKSVFAVQHFNPAHKQEVEDFIRALVAFEDGTSMSVTVSQMCRLPMTRFFVLGAEGTLSYRSGERTCELRREINRLPVTLHPDPLKGDSQEFYNNLGEVLTGGANLLVTPEQTLPMIAIAQAAHLSAARRRLVTIRELGGL